MRGAQILFYSWVFILGILLGSGYVSFCTIIFSLIITLILRLITVPGDKKVLNLLIFILIFWAGWVYILYYTERTVIPANLTGKKVVLKGVARGESVRKNGYTKILLKPQSVKTGSKRQNVHWGLIELTVKGYYFIDQGDFVQACGVLSTPSAPKNPAEFNQVIFEKGRGIAGFLNVASREIVYQSKGCLKEILLNFRRKNVKLIQETIPEPYSNLLTGILLGDDDLLDNEVKELFRELGLSHLLAISGLHIGFVVLFLNFILRKVNPGRKTGFIFSMVVILGYVAITGSSPATLRAGIMAVLFLFAEYFLSIRKNNLNLLGLAMWYFILKNPYVLFLAGFQLSFLVTFSIIFLKRPLDFIIQKFLKNKYRVEYLSLNISAFLGSLPLQLYHFYSFSWGVFFCNIWAVPLVGIALLLGLAGLSVGLINDIFARIFFNLSYLFLYLLIRGIKFIAEAGNFSLYFYKPLLGQIFIFFLGLILLGEGLKGFLIPGWKRPKYQLIAGFILMVFLFMPVCQNNFTGITFLAVGQGDAALIDSGISKILVDCGGDFSAGYRVIVPFLLSRGINQLDGIVVSHFDIDHYRHLEYLLHRLKIKNIYLPENYPPPSNIIQVLRKKKVKINYLKKGFIMSDGNLSLKVLNPGGISRGNSNKDSIVLLGKFGKFSFLLPGDIDKEGMDEILTSYKGKIDIIKAPHHGSDDSFSPEFYSFYLPQIVIISSGKNSYGHPGPTLLKFFDKNNISYLITEKDGAIQFFPKTNYLKSYFSGKIIKMFQRDN